MKKKARKGKVIIAFQTSEAQAEEINRFALAEGHGTSGAVRVLIRKGLEAT